jgi:hypothetical protein
VGPIEQLLVDHFFERLSLLGEVLVPVVDPGHCAVGM